MSTRLELLVQREEDPEGGPGGDKVRLLCPGVGRFTGARRRGAILTAGDVAGHLHTLSRTAELIVPAGVCGVIESEPPRGLREPVDHGRLLYELGELEGNAGAAAREDAQIEADLVVPSPQTGRFYHRPGPDRDPFVEPGSVIEAGSPIGLIEVMKTFTRVVYEPGGALPARARFVRFVAGDRSDVSEGAALVEIEPA